MDKELRLKKYLEEHPKAAKLFFEREENLREIKKRKQERIQKFNMRKKLYMELRQKGFTYQQIAESEGITRQRVQQITAAQLKTAQK